MKEKDAKKPAKKPNLKRDSSSAESSSRCTLVDNRKSLAKKSRRETGIELSGVGGAGPSNVAKEKLASNCGEINFPKGETLPVAAAAAPVPPAVDTDDRNSSQNNRNVDRPTNVILSEFTNDNLNGNIPFEPHHTQCILQSDNRGQVLFSQSTTTGPSVAANHISASVRNAQGNQSTSNALERGSDRGIIDCSNIYPSTNQIRSQPADDKGDLSPSPVVQSDDPEPDDFKMEYLYDKINNKFKNNYLKIASRRKPVDFNDYF